MTKFAAYVAQILLCKSCKFGEKICYSNWDNEFFLRDCFLLAHPVYMGRIHDLLRLSALVCWSYRAWFAGGHDTVVQLTAWQPLHRVVTVQQRRVFLTPYGCLFVSHARILLVAFLSLFLLPGLNEVGHPPRPVITSPPGARVHSAVERRVCISNSTARIPRKPSRSFAKFSKYSFTCEFGSVLYFLLCDNLAHLANSPEGLHILLVLISFFFRPISFFNDCSENNYIFQDLLDRFSQYFHGMKLFRVQMIDLDLFSRYFKGVAMATNFVKKLQTPLICRSGIPKRNWISLP